MSARLEVRGLSITLDGRAVVQGLDLELGPGEVLGLIGRSGSGKSLTAKAMLGLLPASGSAQGSIRLDDLELTGLDARGWRTLRGRRIGLILQEPATALDPVMSIGRQVAEGLRVHGLARSGRQSRDMAGEVLRHVGLDGDAVPSSHRPHQLSGGQRQRVAIAAALALRPDILIADEPTTALDPLTGEAVLRRLVQPVQEDGRALLLIGHDLERVAAFADRLVVIEDGRPVVAGPTLDVLEGQASAVRRLRAAANPQASMSAVDVGQPPVLEATGLTRLYGPAGAGRRAGVHDVSFKLRRGERLVILGETGAGKSTLLRLVLGLERPDSGGVVVMGQSFNPARAGDARALRRHIQPVFQDPVGSFDPLWTVERIVFEPLQTLRLSKADAAGRVEAALEAVGLSTADRFHHAASFSGGQRQRLALARALVSQPDVLVLDEATAALDVVTRSEVLDLLVRLGRDRGLALLVVTHDLTVARRLADQVMVLRNGEVVEAGPAHVVLSTPSHPYTRAVVEASPGLDAVLARLRARQG